MSSEDEAADRQPGGEQPGGAFGLEAFTQDDRLRLFSFTNAEKSWVSDSAEFGEVDSDTMFRPLPVGLRPRGPTLAG